MESRGFVIPLHFLVLAGVAFAQSTTTTSPPNLNGAFPPPAETPTQNSTPTSTPIASEAEPPASTISTEVSGGAKGTDATDKSDEAPATSSTTSATTSSGSSTGEPAMNTGTLSSPGISKPVLTGLVALFAVLFAIALAAAIFFFIKRRQDRRKAYLSPAYSTPESAGPYSDKGANAQIDSLQTQLADANKRLTAVQGSLLAAGQKPQTKDDNTLSREYTQINTDVVGWAGNYFKASSDPINLTTELYEFLTEYVPNYQALLSSGKSKQLVVRAIVSQVLQESFEKNAFFGNALAAITPLIRTSSATPPAINNWRSETFFLLEKSEDFASQRRAAISTITDKIEQLTYPLAGSKQSFQGDPARYKFLEGIITKASDLALALGKQRANFQLLSEPASCEFGYATMDDVSQQTDTVTNSDGSTSHPLEGRPIQATVFPLLLKYGNESGEGYEQITILSKAKVLV